MIRRLLSHHQFVIQLFYYLTTTTKRCLPFSGAKMKVFLVAGQNKDWLASAIVMADPYAELHTV